MDRVVIDEKIESLRRCVLRVQASVPDSIEAFRDTESTPPSTMGEVFSALSDTGFISEELAGSLRRAVGFRNVAVHAYDDLNLEIVYAIATQHLNEFRGFAAAVSKN